MRMNFHLLSFTCIIPAVFLLTSCQFFPGNYPNPIERTREAEATLLLTYSEPAGERFVLTGDLHCHSQVSNGSGIPTSRVLADSVKVGYDFVALTDHESLEQNQYDWSTPDLLVLSGMEISTNLDHFNIFGLTELSDIRRSFSTITDFNTYIDYLHSLGALIQHNHPNEDLDASVPFSYNLNTDFVEILNDTVTSEDTRTLVRDFKDMLSAGKHFVGTAGSDAHSSYDNRHVFNHVWVAERSEVAVLYALKRGHSFVTTAANGPVISLTCGDAIMGDSVAFSDGQIVNITITGLSEGSFVKVFDINDLLSEHEVTVSSFLLSVPTQSDMGLVRVEIWSPDGGIIAFSNPLYIN